MRAGNINNFSEIANIIYILSTCEWSHYFKNKFYYVRWKISIRKKSETGIQFLNAFFAGVSIFLLTFSILSEVLLASNAKHSWKLKSYMTLRGNYGFLILLFLMKLWRNFLDFNIFSNHQNQPCLQPKAIQMDSTFRHIS